MSFDLNHPDYVELRALIRENPKDFVAIVGAGLSTPAGIPNWSGLRDYVVKNARDRVSEVPEESRAVYEADLKLIEKKADLWDAFSDLKRLLPETAYENSIRKALTLKDRKSVPETYHLLWKLNIKGIVTFNLDTCARDSFSYVNHHEVDSAVGTEISRYSRFLSGTHPFVFCPHGRLEDSNSWVFTVKERDELLKTSEYIDFVKALFQTKNTIIVGFNPNEFMFKFVQGYLSKSSGSRHFILVSRPDLSQTHIQSEKGFSVIPYSTKDPALHLEIQEAFKDWLNFKPRDEAVGSIFAGPAKSPESLPPENEMLQLPVHEVRELLNGAIAGIIPPAITPKPEDAERLQKFYNTHLRTINQAWLVKPKTECDQLHGYRVTELIGRGAFGQVFEAESLSDGTRVAIKILLPEMRDENEYLNSFRRGARSMKILAHHKINRIVKFVNSYEVPACIIMEFVDGLSLTKAKQQNLLYTLETCLETLIQIGETVSAAHEVNPEHVLHRDLKPDNIILKGAYQPGDLIDVVVLDFDLSWHQGAFELSVIHGARAQGYAAPEQTATGKHKDSNIRHFSVDVFGFGMLAYFVFTGTDPRPNEQNFENFEAQLKKNIRLHFPSEWRCLAGYLAHTIVECTRDDQKDRISLKDAVQSLRDAKEMISNNVIESSNPLVLEELAGLLFPDSIPKRTNYGRSIEVSGPDESKKTFLDLSEVDGEMVVKISMLKTRASFDDWSSVEKYLPTIKDKVLSILNKAPLSSTDFDIKIGLFKVSTQWRLKKKLMLSDIRKVSEQINTASAMFALQH